MRFDGLHDTYKCTCASCEARWRFKAHCRQGRRKIWELEVFDRAKKNYEQMVIELAAEMVRLAS